MSEQGFFCLIKFGKKFHMENLLNNGEICFNPIEYFNNSSEDERGDFNEGVVELENVILKEIQVEHPILGTQTFKMDTNSNSKLRIYNNDPNLIFSSYAITNDTFQNSSEHLINEKMLEFGEYAVIIKEPIKFINTITNKLSEQGLSFEDGMIEYLDYTDKEKYELTLFNKSEDFKHQAEYRIIIKSSTPERKLIQIGSIQDYAHIFKTLDFIRQKWTLKENKK